MLLSGEVGTMVDFDVATHPCVPLDTGTQDIDLAGSASAGLGINMTIVFQRASGQLVLP